MNRTFSTEETIQAVVSIFLLYHHYELPQFYLLSHGSESQNPSKGFPKLKSRCQKAVFLSDVLRWMSSQPYSSCWQNSVLRGYSTQGSVFLLFLSQGSSATSRSRPHSLVYSTLPSSLKAIHRKSFSCSKCLSSSCLPPLLPALCTACSGRPLCILLLLRVHSITLIQLDNSGWAS